MEPVPEYSHAGGGRRGAYAAAMAARKTDSPIDDPHPRRPDRIRVGIGGWDFAPWRGTFYPAGLPQRRELEFASRHMDAIEVNGTYYRPQSAATYAKWRDASPEGFVFSAKAPMRITQARDLSGTARQVEDFVGGIATLGAKLGPLVWQFDAGTRVRLGELAAFLPLLPKQVDGIDVRHVLDVRDRTIIGPEYVAMAREYGCAIVLSDSPDHPMFTDVTTDFVYVRVMRARESLPNGYEAAALDAWMVRARQWAAGIVPQDLPAPSGDPPPKRRREVFLYFIAAAKVRNPAAALALRRRLAAG